MPLPLLALAVPSFVATVVGWFVSFYGRFLVGKFLVVAVFVTAYLTLIAVTTTAIQLAVTASSSLVTNEIILTAMSFMPPNIPIILGLVSTLEIALWGHRQLKFIIGIKASGF